MLACCIGIISITGAVVAPGAIHRGRGNVQCQRRAREAIYAVLTGGKVVSPVYLTETAAA
jgi:hypothetical protein